MTERPFDLHSLLQRCISDSIYEYSGDTETSDFFALLAKRCNEIYEAEALAAFQRYKESAWLDIPAKTLNELLHLIQTKEYQRGYNDAKELYDDSE